MGDKQSPEINSDRDGGSKQANRAGQVTQEEAKKIEVGMVVEADEGGSHSNVRRFNTAFLWVGDRAGWRIIGDVICLLGRVSNPRLPAFLCARQTILEVLNKTAWNKAKALACRV